MSTGQQHTHRNSAVLRVKATRSKMISFLLVLDVKCTLSLGMGRTNLSGDVKKWGERVKTRSEK